jgi:hypothetical protein
VNEWADPVMSQRFLEGGFHEGLATSAYFRRASSYLRDTH